MNGIEFEKWCKENNFTRVDCRADSRNSWYTALVHASSVLFKDATVTNGYKAILFNITGLNSGCGLVNISGLNYLNADFDRLKLLIDKISESASLINHAGINNTKEIEIYKQLGFIELCQYDNLHPTHKRITKKSDNTVNTIFDRQILLFKSQNIVYPKTT